MRQYLNLESSGEGSVYLILVLMEFVRRDPSVLEILLVPSLHLAFDEGGAAAEQLVG